MPPARSPVWEPGSRVLEVGCGTGKLTEALVERGLVVDAVDPGANMIAFARKRVRDSDAVEFHLGRFEEVALPGAGLRRRVLGRGVPLDRAGGRLGESRSLPPPRRNVGVDQCTSATGTRALATDDEALHELFEEVLARNRVPGHPSATWSPFVPESRSAAKTSPTVWTWLGHRDLDNAEAASLFDDVRLTTQPVAREQTADQLWALFATTSLYHAPRSDRARGAGVGGSPRSSSSGAARSTRAT